MRIEDVSEIIDKYFQNFIFTHVDGSYNSFIQAYLLGKMRSYIEADNFNQLQKEILYHRMSDRDQNIAKYLKEGLREYFKKIQERTKSTLIDELLNQNKDNLIDKEIMEGKLDPRRLARILREKTGDIYTDFQRTAATELASAKNMGQLTHLIEKYPDKDPKEVLVYMVGPWDQATCRFCLDMYHDGSSFKIYRLSEVLANGSAYGKKLEIGGPVHIPPLHPNCRHNMIELPPGFTLNENGIATYVHPEHHELDNSKK